MTRKVTLLFILLLASRPVALLADPLAPEAESAPNAMDIDTEALEMRDPFRRPFVAKSVTNRPLGPLEAYAVDQYQMVGSIVGTDRVRAILQDPSGRTHIVSEKMKIGMKQGVIREIRANRVRVREMYINAIGREEAIDIEIKLLPKDQSLRTAGGDS